MELLAKQRNQKAKEGWFAMSEVESSITSLNSFTPEQMAFILAHGPSPNDGGAVNSFTHLFIGEFGVSISPTVMRPALAKAKRKRRKDQRKKGEQQATRVCLAISSKPALTIPRQEPVRRPRFNRRICC